MKVYVLIRYHYDSLEVLGVYKDEQSAIKAERAYVEQDSVSQWTYDIEEHTLDQ